MLTKATLGGKLLFPSDYVAAIEFRGKDVTLTVSGVRIEELKMAGGKKDSKPVVSFKETKKRLILNKTNAATIATIYGPKAEEWLGKKITLFPTRTQCGSGVVDCIRVRESSPNGQHVEPPPVELETPPETEWSDLPDSPFAAQPDTQPAAEPEQPGPLNADDGAPAGEGGVKQPATPQELFEAFKSDCMDALKANGLTVSQRSAAWAREMVAKGVKGKEWEYPQGERGALYAACETGEGATDGTDSK